MKWEMGHEKTDEGDWNGIKLADGGNRFKNKQPSAEEFLGYSCLN